jgi:DNA-binding SARP family transcriptional activator/class 3 adenylate cyclase
MEVRVLGSLEVVGEHGLVRFPRGRARALLALLALRPGEVVSAERLIDELWGERPPPTARTALQGLVARLRRCLEPAQVLKTRQPGYLLAIEREQVDAYRFRQQVAQAAQAETARRAELLREALELWRGPALHEFTYEPFAQAAIADLTELRLAAVTDRIDADLALGRHTELVAELQRLTAEHPLRERLWEQLMLALYRCGRQADALAAYRRIRRRLVFELGVEPGPALQELERSILTQAPSLTAAGVVSRTGPQPAPAAPPPAPGWLAGDRRIATALIADLSPVDPAGDLEAARHASTRGYDTAAEVVARHGGTIDGFLGDVVLGVFGVPVAHEDDALRAVRAAHELRTRLAAWDAKVRPSTRVGIDTGEVLVGASAAGPATSGPPVALAIRLQQAAAGGEVLLGEATRRLVAGAVRVEPADGIDEAWRLVDVSPATLAADPGPSTTQYPSPGNRYVGRLAELAQLRQAYQRCVREQRAVLVTVVGEPGIGKSRLAREFACTVPAKVLTGHCPSYGEGITFWPLREILRSMFDSQSRVAALLAGDPAAAAAVAAVAGFTDDPAASDELFPAVRRLCEVAAADQPLVLVLEDIHWAQPTLLDLIEHLAGEVAAPLLLLCLARPELAEQRPAWAGSVDDAVELGLVPLPPADAQRLLAHRPGGEALPAEARTRLVELAQGNPLFLGQLLAAVREGQQAELPPTLQALLTARLDRLGPAERALLRGASVIGRECPEPALAAVLPEPALIHVPRHLSALAARELVTFAQPGMFRFRHALIQRTAYASLTRQARSYLHEQVADWLDSAGPVAGYAEVDELVGHHLEQAHYHRREVGQADPGLARRAGERLARAGLRAYARFDMPAAENLLARARALLPTEHPQRPQVLRRLTEAYPIMGRPVEAEGAFAELLQLAGDDGPLVRSIRVERARFRLITGPDPIHLQDIRVEAERALAAFDATGDEVGMSQACYVLAFTQLRAGQMAELLRTARRGLEHAARSGDLREQLGAPWWLLLGLLAGSTPVSEALPACAELVEVGGVEHPGSLAALGYLRAMAGDVDQARDLVAGARDGVRERIRVPRPLVFVNQCAARIETLAGDPGAAEQALRPALAIAQQVAERDSVAEVAADLSLLCADRGAAAEAAALADLARQQAPAESVTANALARAATGRAGFASGEPDTGLRLVAEAAAIVPGDMLNLRAQLHLIEAQLLANAGRSAAARAATSVAADLYRRKGNLAGAARSSGVLRQRGGSR